MDNIRVTNCVKEYLHHLTTSKLQISKDKHGVNYTFIINNVFLEFFYTATKTIVVSYGTNYQNANSNNFLEILHHKIIRFKVLMSLHYVFTKPDASESVVNIC